MPNFPPNAEQTSIISRFTSEAKTNLIIEARAGCAKTTTIEFLAETLAPAASSLCLAFNKSVQLEMQQRLPEHIECKTLNSIGHQIWGRYLRKKLTLDSRKMSRLIATHYNAVFNAAEKKAFLKDHGDDFKAFIDHAKNLGYVPPKTSPILRAFTDEFTVLASFYQDVPSEWVVWMNQILTKSYTEALDGTIDFADQIVLPCTCRSVNFPRYKELFVDEAQDLSALNHYIVKKLSLGGRITAVGDPFQAIYAFRGADSNSMSNMKKMFSMETMFLTINYRCGQAILDNVKWRAPDIQPMPDVHSGAVTNLGMWDESQISPGDAILCRNNAPLFRLAIKLISANRSIDFRGKDVLMTLIKNLRGLGPLEMLSAQAEAEAQKWLAKNLDKTRRKSYINDMFECMSIFINSTSTLGEAVRKVDKLANASGQIILVTGHKAKGLEFDNVFFLDVDLIDMREEQDKNLRYVIETRAKNNLFYVNENEFLS
jgi:superfamily I DNA/RNA helicase